MKVKQLIDKILDRWHIKVICFLIAIFLYIFHQMSLVDTKSITVPLTVTENGLVVHTNDIQKYVSVVIKADSDAISTVHADDFKAFINLDYQTEKGNITAPVNIEVSQKILTMDPIEVKVRPETINVQIEPKLSRFVPAEANLAGELPAGYEIDDITVSPDYVEIYGPESVVKAIQKIQTDKVNISGITKKINAKVGFINKNQVINIDDKLSFDVEVSVKPIIIEKNYTDVSVVPKNLKGNLKLDSPLPAVSFTAKGSVPFFEGYQLSPNTVQIDLESVSEPGKYSLPLKIILPQALTLVSKSDENIDIEVSIIEELPVVPETENIENSENQSVVSAEKEQQ